MVCKAHDAHYINRKSDVLNLSIYTYDNGDVMRVVAVTRTALHKVAELIGNQERLVESASMSV